MGNVLDLQPGALVQHEGRCFLITRTLDFETVLGKDVATKVAERLPIAALLPPGYDADGVTPQPFEGPTTTDAEWEEAYRRYGIVRPLLDGRRHTKAEVQVCADKAGVHVSTVYLWLNRYQTLGRLSAFLPNRPAGGKGKGRLDPVVEGIIRDVLESTFLTAQKPSPAAICRDIEQRCKTVGRRPPAKRTLYRRVSWIDERTKLQRRESEQRAQERYDPEPGSTLKAEFILQVVQIDHTKLGVILVDDVKRRPIGRPWITVAIDVFSRMITGFYLSLDPPSASSAGLCLVHAVCPKDDWLAKLGIETPWPCWGKMQTLHMDNAMEFRSRTLEWACREHAIDPMFRAVKKPKYGAYIESLLGTVAEDLKRIPGATFSGPLEKGEYDPEDYACMTLREIESWLANYFTGDYHQRPHGQLGMPPLRKWEEGIFGTGERPGKGLPSRIMDRDRLRLDFMPLFTRGIRNDGVLLDGIHYYHDVLRRWINARDTDEPKRAREFVFKRDPRDVSVVYFYDPDTKRYYAIPYRNTSWPPMSLWELRAIRRRLQAAGCKDIDERVIFETRAKLRRIESEAAQETARTRREEQRRRTYQTADKPVASPPPAHGDNVSETPILPSLPTDILPFDDLDPLIETP